MNNLMRPRVALLFGFAILSTLTSITGTSRGDDTTSAVDSDERAAQYYEQGVAASKAGQLQKARDAFLAAWNLKHHYQIAANLGRTEARLGDYRDAAEHLAYFLREAKDLARDERALAQKLFDDARSRVGTVKIVVDRPSAEVRVDGVVVGTSPFMYDVYVDPGPHRFEAALRGFVTAREHIEANRNGSYEVKLSLMPSPNTSNTSSTISTTPADKGSRDTCDDPRWPILTAGGALTLIGLGLGVGGVIISNKNAAERDNVANKAPYADQADDWDAAVKRRVTWANVALGSFIGAGVAASATATYAIVSCRRERPSSGLRVSVPLEDKAAGITISGSW